MRWRGPGDDPANATGMPLDAEDYYFENGLIVFTEQFHRKRGYCCGNNCRHCPYDHENVPDANGQKKATVRRNEPSP